MRLTGRCGVRVSPWGVWVVDGEDAGEGVAESFGLIEGMAVGAGEEEMAGVGEGAPLEEGNT